MAYVRYPGQEAAQLTASRVLVSDANGLPSASAVVASDLLSMPIWTKYTVGHAALQAAATTNNITLFSLPAKTVINKVIIKHTVAFAGGAISAYTVSVGIAGTLAKYCAAFDVFQAVANGTFAASATTVNATLEDFAAATAIKIAATSTSANLDQTTAGSVDVYVLTSLLP